MNTLELDGKKATSIMLHCPSSCGGFVEDAMLIYIYINEEHEIVIYSRCGCCNQFGSVTIPLLDLLSYAPQTVVM
jgi:hypothetical protein